MSKTPQPSRPKDTRPPKDKPPFPKRGDDDFDAYIRELVDAAPPLDPGSAQFQRLRAICAPTYQRLADKAA